MQCTSEAKRNVETGLNEQWFGRMWFDEGGSLRTMLGICEAMDPPEDEDDDAPPLLLRSSIGGQLS